MRFLYTEVGTLVASRDASKAVSYFRASAKNFSCLFWALRMAAVVVLKLARVP